MASIPIEVIISATDRASGPIGRVSGALSGLSRTGRGVGQVAGGIARLGMVAGTVAAGGLVASAKAALTWESALAGVNKTLDVTPRELQSIGRELRDLATTIPIGAAELAALAETAGALGIAKKDVTEFARVTALLGVTTNVTADAAATSLGTLSNVLGLTAKDYEKFGSTLVDLGNKGASTEAQILGIAERAGAAGALIGLSADKVLGFSSAAANLGIEVEAAGSSLQRFFIDGMKAVSAGGDELDLFAKTAGMSAKAFKAAFEKDAAGALDAFIVGLGKVPAGDRLAVLEDLGFNDIRITRLLLGLAGNTDNLTKSLDIAGDAWQENSALGVEAGKRFETVQSKLALLKNGLTEAAITIGEGFTPALGRLAERLADFLKENRGALVGFGEQIGKALDSIDFDALLATVRDIGRAFRDDVLPVIKTAIDLFRQLPGPVQAIGAAAIIGANTPIVGGALSQIGRGVGNIGMGALGLLGSALPGRAGQIGGALFAQRVFVTNWPLGGLGGGVGAAGAGGKLGGISGILGWVGIAGLTIAAGQAIADAVGATPENPMTGASRGFYRDENGASTTFPKIPGQMSQGLTGQLSGAPGGGGRTPLRTLLFGAHDTGAFSASDLTAFRSDPAQAVALFDERIRYLAGAQGSGAGSAEYLALVSRDISALTSLLPSASESQKVAITNEIKVLQGILEAKKFTIDKSTIDAATGQVGREVAAAIRDNEWSPPPVMVTVNVSPTIAIQTQAKKTVVSSKYGVTYTDPTRGLVKS